MYSVIQADDNATALKDRPEGDRENKSNDGSPNPQQRRDDSSKETMSPRRRFLLFGIGGLVLLAAGVGGVLYWLHARHYESTDDAFVDGHISQVASQVPGHVTRLLITDNQLVQAGQTLVEIDPRDYQVRLVQARAQLASSSAQLQQAQAQLTVRQADLAQAIANKDVAAADAARARVDLARYRGIDPRAISRQQLDDASAAARSSDARLDASGQAVAGAQAQIDVAKAQIVSAQAGMRQAQSNVANAELQLSYTEVTAPSAGRITKRTVEVGNYVSPGAALLAIVQSDLWVTANFKETQLALMHPGQKVAVTVDSVPKVVFPAHIDSFQSGTGSVFSQLPAENATGNYVKVVQRIPVKIVFDDPGQVSRYPLSPGMSVDPEVTVR